MTKKGEKDISKVSAAGEGGVLEPNQLTHRRPAVPSLGSCSTNGNYHPSVHSFNLVDNRLQVRKPKSQAHDTTKPSPVILTGLLFKMTFVLVFTLLLVLSFAASEVTHIECRDDLSFTSPNYPSNYPNYANKRWFITAPKGSRILVTFNDFNVEVDDFLDLADKVDKKNSKRYTGEEMEFPPFLTRGNELEMTFISFASGTRRGFNVSASCYDLSRDANVARIVGGNFPGKGFLELRNQSDDWRRVCKDDFDERVAEVVCGELGYPAVREVSYEIDDCKSNGQDCSKVSICNEYTYRLEDCSWSPGYCTSADAVKVECYEPGFKGCYDPAVLPQQNGFIFESTSQCVSSCRAIPKEALAIMIGTQCFCSTADEVNLPNITPEPCNQPTQSTRRVINSFVYDVSVGFCEELDYVIHGSSDSNITWFGSIVRLTCDDGYSLNGNRTLQCVPGLSPDHPTWNDSLPSCDKRKGTEWFSTTQNIEDGKSSGNDTQEKEENPGEQFNAYYFLLLIPGIAIIGITAVIIFKTKRIRDKLLACLSRSRTTYTRDKKGKTSVRGKEMPGEEPGNLCTLVEAGRESPQEHDNSLMMIEGESNQL